MAYIKCINFEGSERAQICSTNGGILATSATTYGFDGYLTLSMDVVSIGYDPIPYTIIDGDNRVEREAIPALLTIPNNAFAGCYDYIVGTKGEDFYNELVSVINTFNANNAQSEAPLTFAGGIFFAQYVEFIEGAGILTPSNSGYGSEANNVINENSLNYLNYLNIYSKEPQRNAEIYAIMDFLNVAIDNEIIEPSDAIKSFISDNSTFIVKDTATHYDVYINSFRVNNLMGGYQLNSIEVRWSCPAVNIATDEYLQNFPDYPYRANNTKIKIGISPISGTTISDEVGQFPYGNKFFKVLKDRIYDNKIIDYISNVIVTDDIADKYIVLGTVFSDGTEKIVDRCSAQIPLNKLLGNTSGLRTTNGADGSTITLHWGEPTEPPSDKVAGWNIDDPFGTWGIDDINHFDPDITDVTVTAGVNSNISVLTKSYVVSNAELLKLGNTLWSDSFYNDIEKINNSPIENIIAVKSFPMNLGNAPDTNITLGNVETTSRGYLLPSSFNPKKTIGTFKVKKKFSGHLDWLNYPPYTNVKIFCPYCSYHDIDITPYMDKNITVEYIYDVITGVCSVNLKCGNVEFAKFSGTMAIDIPIASSNRAQVEAGYLMGGINAVGNLLSGNLLGAFASGAQALMTPYHTNVSGSPSPSCDAFDNQNCFVIVDYPVYYEPSDYNHQFGYPCNKTLSLKDKKGFIQTEDVDVTGINCTEEERAEIKRLLDSGVYL